MTADQVHDSSDVAFIDILRVVADAATHAVLADLAQRHRPGTFIERVERQCSAERPRSGAMRTHELAHHESGQDHLAC